MQVADSSQPIPLGFISQINLTLEDSDFAYKIDLVSSTELALSYRTSVDHDKIEL